MLFLVLPLFLVNVYGIVNSKTAIGDQIKAVQGLIGRVLDGEQFVKKFDIRIDPTKTNYFEVWSSGGLIVLSAEDGVGLSSAFFFYLREYMNSMYTWETKHIDTSSFPLPTTKVVKKSTVKHRYMFNTCTFGYTMAMWTFKEWEKLIDWMALHGINLPLSFVGQEFIWLKTFESFGVSTDEMLSRYFSGPLFLPWNRMGNIKRWGSPLSENFINDQISLQKQILERERSFGMIPVLPGYPGFVPDEFIKLYPNVSVTKETPWGRFNQTFTSVYLLDPTEPIFIDIGSKFLEVLNETYGPLEEHIYNVDTFNEMQPKRGDTTYLKEVSQSIFNSLRKYDPEAIWMLQGWLFYADRKFWTTDRVASYLSPVPNDRMLILDLYAENYPVWKKTESFFSKPFVWCMLKNFGGRRGFFGNVLEFPKNVVVDRENNSSTMVGTGITSEAIFVPPMPYELFSDMYLQETPMSDPEIIEWVMKYVGRRYGFVYNDDAKWNNVTEAWKILTNEVYNYMTSTNTLDTVASFPTFDLESIDDPDYVYAVTQSYHLFHSTFISLDPTTVTDGMKYDYVDLTRQFLSDLINDVYNMIFVRFYDDRNEEIKSLTDSMLDIVSDLDDLLLTTDHFLLGRWIQMARNKGSSDDEKNLFEFNARNQLSLWGPPLKGIDHDYAQKFWNGLVGDYYYQRWSIFFKYVNAANPPHHFDKEKYTKEQEEYEVSWMMEKKKYPEAATLDLFTISKKIYQKYASSSTYTLEKDTEPKDRLFEELVETYARDISSLSYLCDIDPLCFGFTSDGCLFSKKGVVETKKKQGIDLYVKKNV